MISPTDPCPASYTYLQGQCYMYDPTLNYSWQESKDHCKLDMAELAAFESSGEHIDVMEWLETGNAQWHV